MDPVFAISSPLTFEQWLNLSKPFYMETGGQNGPYPPINTQSYLFAQTLQTPVYTTTLTEQ